MVWWRRKKEGGRGCERTGLGAVGARGCSLHLDRPKETSMETGSVRSRLARATEGTEAVTPLILKNAVETRSPRKAWRRKPNHASHRIFTSRVNLFGIPISLWFLRGLRALCVSIAECIESYPEKRRRREGGESLRRRVDQRSLRRGTESASYRDRVPSSRHAQQDDPNIIGRRVADLPQPDRSGAAEPRCFRLRQGARARMSPPSAPRRSEADES